MFQKVADKSSKARGINLKTVFDVPTPRKGVMMKQEAPIGDYLENLATVRQVPDAVSRYKTSTISKFKEGVHVHPISSRMQHQKFFSTRNSIQSQLSNKFSLS